MYVFSFSLISATQPVIIQKLIITCLKIITGIEIKKKKIILSIGNRIKNLNRDSYSDSQNEK